MKVLILDSGPLINFAMNGLLDTLRKLKLQFKGKFLITKAVKYEVIDRPSTIQRFELGALQIQKLLEEKVLEMPDSMGIDENILKEESLVLLDTANHYFQVDNQWMAVVSEAEMSCLALADEVSRQGIETLIAVDERTTRMLAERPQNLAQLISERVHKRVELVLPEVNIFQKYKFIRSSELVYVAYKRGLLNLNNKNALEAALFATKFKGSSISWDEINQLKKL